MAVLVGVTFRSVVAPVVTLLTVGAAVTLGVGGYVGQLLGVSVPADLEAEATGDLAPAAGPAARPAPRGRTDGPS